MRYKKSLLTILMGGALIGGAYFYGKSQSCSCEGEIETNKYGIREYGVPMKDSYGNGNNELGGAPSAPSGGDGPLGGAPSVPSGGSEINPKFDVKTAKIVK